MGIKFERKKEKEKITLIAILLAGSCFLTYYFHEILETGTFFTHLFYIPIILASLWWKRKGLVIAIFLAAFLIFSHYFLRHYAVTANDYLRALMFIVIGLVVALLRERIAKNEEALRRSEEKSRGFMESATDAFSLFDSELNFVEINKAEMKLFPPGTAKEDVVGKNVLEWAPNLKPTGRYDKYLEVIKTGEPFSADDVVTDPMLGEKHVNVRAFKVGNGLGIVLTDISERVQGEQALRDSEEKYRMLFEHANIAIFVAQDGMIKSPNPKALDLHGYSEEEFTSKPFINFIHPEDQKMVQDRHERRLRGEELPHTYSYRIINKAGDTKWVELNVVPLLWEGKPATLCFMTDITEQKLAQEALRESEEKYRTILESIEDGYFEVDIRGNFTFFNDSLCKIHGYSKHELMGMNNRQYVDEETAKKIYQAFNKVYTTGEPARGFEWEIIRKDGTKRYVQSSVSLIKDSEGERIGFRGIIRDITERKQMETELIQTKNFLQSILDSSIDGITTTDLQGNVIYTSPRTKDILGYKQEKIIGKKVYAFYGNGIEDAKTIMKELTEKGELRDHEMKFIRKDGELIDINLSASLLKDEKGEVIGTVGIYRDITEKNMLEAQLAQAQRMEAIGTLAGGMAHNFNNLLMGIQGNASIMLLDVDSTHPHHERLKSIEEGVQRGSRLTRQLLGYARGGKYEPRPISLNQLVKETSNTFSETRKEVVLHQELAEGLYGIKADRSQIEQTLLNLYVNAAEAMPDGGDLFLKTTNVTYKDMKGKPYEPKPGNYVLLTVRDTGTGMDKKTKDRIFDPFFTTKGLARSTGLGLASVYGIVKAHGGYIDVESKRGQGTTFEIYLPATQKEVKEEKKSSGKLVKGKGTILLVDDEEMVIDVGEQMLKKLGYEVYLAKSGQEAIDVYKENKDRIDMVLLDIVMPGMGGGRTYDSLREIDSDIKVLLSSGYDIEGKAKEILERGCDAFIQKPFNMRELSQEVRKILDRVS